MDDVEAVLAAARLRAAALVAADADRLRSLLHPHLRWTTFRGDVLDRDRYVEGNTDGSLVWRAQTLQDHDVVVAGDTAVLTAVVVDDVERDGVPARFRLRLTLTWVRTGEGWRCLSGHAGPRLPEEPEPATDGGLAAAQPCRRCRRPVARDAADYELFEQMHWACFHDEFEHEGDPDSACADPACPARRFDPSPPPTWLDGLP